MVESIVALGSASYAQLMIRITPELGRRCRVELTFTQPGSNAPTEWSGHALFDLDSIREVQNDIDAYATRLSESLFKEDAVREGFRLAQALAGAQQLRLQLYIDTDLADLHTLRWETLRTPDGTP